MVLSPRETTVPVKSFIFTKSPTAYSLSNTIDIPDNKSLTISWNANPITTAAIPSDAIMLLVFTP